MVGSGQMLVNGRYFVLTDVSGTVDIGQKYADLRVRKCIHILVSLVRSPDAGPISYF